MGLVKNAPWLLSWGLRRSRWGQTWQPAVYLHLEIDSLTCHWAPWHVCFAIADRLTGAAFNAIIPQGMFPNGNMYFLLLFSPHSLLFSGLCTGFGTLRHSTHVDPRSLVARVTMAVYIGCQTRSSRTFNLQVGLLRKPLNRFAYMVSGQNP